MHDLGLCDAGAEGASRQDRLNSLFGKKGAGVQLYLQAEMCRGLQWRYGLVFAGCDARNTPVKVGRPHHQTLLVLASFDIKNQRYTGLVSWTFPCIATTSP